MIDEARLRQIVDSASFVDITPPLVAEGVELAREVLRLRARQNDHLAMIRAMSQTVPLEGEVADALEQRGALLAEVGTLRARVAELEKETVDSATERVRDHAEYKARRNEQFEAYEKLRAKHLELLTGHTAEAVSDLMAELHESRQQTARIRDNFKDERVALHRAWFDTVGVLTPDLLSAERQGYDEVVRRLAVAETALESLRGFVLGFAKARNVATASENETAAAFDQADRLLAELVDSVPDAPSVRPEGAQLMKEFFGVDNKEPA